MSHIQSLQPKLVVDGADKAIAFYAAAFDAVASDRFAHGDRVVHAQLTAGGARFTIKDAGDGDLAPSAGGVPVIMSLVVDDADAVCAQALAAGAHVIYPVEDHDYGGGHRDRGGRLGDPFGHQWMVVQPRP
ncbi:VOC family protein [Pseudonocardia sp. CA-107938]|uniref:VOC family protein n=1 Tax=Pseudonocardia sp. CA-107938 TaxID=3240021 RepID=UPI003D9183B7